MREAISSLNFRKIILVSILLGTMFGTIDKAVYAGDDNTGAVTFNDGYGEAASWHCPDAGIISSCTAKGCIKNSGRYWVCKYEGKNCPPLEQCEYR